MGYLDSTTVTVDAVLTKQGRKIISEGSPLDITHFTLSDTGVDYTLWNADHLSGSAFYGSAIDDLPMVEALPLTQYALRNKLVSLGRDTDAMPSLVITPMDPTLDVAGNFPITADIKGYAAIAGGGAGGIHIVNPDHNVLQIVSGTPIDITGNFNPFILEADIPSTRVHEVAGAGPQYTINVTPTEDLNEDRTITLTFIHIATGAWQTAQVTVKANITPTGQTLGGAGNTVG